MQQQQQPNGPLAGYRVLDFGWVLAGAIPGMVLADMGAEVIKVETRQRLDYMRQGRPIIGTERDPEQHPMFHNVNRGKLSVTLNTNHAEAVALARRLAAHCDVVIENFSPGVMERLGLSYNDLKAVRDDIVMVSVSSNGQTGPLRDLRAYAPSIGAMAGLDSTLGYEGERPLGLKHAYADIAGALHAVFAIVSALYRRRRTGRGQYIDLSMLKATAATLGAGLMEYEATGRVLGPMGNYDPTMAPYGNYPLPGRRPLGLNSRGQRRRVARAGGGDGVARMGIRRAFRQPLPASPKPPRTGRSDIAEWTSARDAWEITELLQSRGVAAMPVMDAEERLYDRHNRERGLYREIEHPALGVEPIFNLMWNLDKTPPSIRSHAPTLGQHNRQVLCDMLGLSQSELSDLEERQVVY